MSSFIPMVSSSPPPMDEGGGFDWDDDDDEFGTFTSADTSLSFKIDESFKPSGLNQSVNSINDIGNEEFADFTAFEGNSNPCVDSKLSDTDRDVPSSIPSSNDSMNSGSINSDERGFSTMQHSKSGPLSDSGMFSSEISPVPQNEEEPTSVKKYEHTDSLDDIQTDSSTECVVNDELESPCDKVIVNVNETESETDLVHTNHDRDETGESVIVKGHENFSLGNNKDSPIIDPPATTAYLDNTVCSNDKTQTSNDNDNIPESRTDHSSFETNANDIKDSSGSASENEACNVSREIHSIHSLSLCLTANTETDHIENPVKSSVGSELDKESHISLLHRSSEQENRVTSSDLIEEDLDIPTINTLTQNDPGHVICDSNSVCVADVEHFINDKILPEAVKKFASNASNIDSSIGASDINVPSETDHITDKLTYQESKEDSSYNAQQTNIEPNKQGTVPVMEEFNSAHCEDFGEFEDFNNDEKKGTIENIEAKISIEENEFRDYSSVSETDFSHIAAPNSPDSTSQEVIVPKTKETHAASDDDDDDDFCDFSSSSVEVTKTNNNTESVVESSEIIVSNTSEPVGCSDSIGTTQNGTDSNLSKLSKPSESQGLEEEDDFGDFSDFTAGTSALDNAVDTSLKNDSFANFPSESSGEANNDWAAFDETQALTKVDRPVDDEDWGDFGDETSTSVKLSEAQPLPAVTLQNMTKHEKLMFAVTSCFPDLEKQASKMNVPVNDLKGTDGQKSSSDPNLWVQIRNLQSSKEVSYQWTKSEWNSQLFTTLHIDTRNVLFGHKKASVPIYAAGLTLLEPVKGSSEGMLKPDVLVDTMKTDNGSQQSQETIPPAQFDWTGSGLTNPLEANNKTLNLDFLIQDQSTKSSELESEFLKPEPVPVMKPAIQPLENILANLKSSSTFKPASQTEDISPEAQKVVQTLPNLTFMKSSVLMFPLHME